MSVCFIHVYIFADAMATQDSQFGISATGLASVDVMCNGDELDINSCPQSSLTADQCTGAAGVICSRGT